MLKYDIIYTAGMHRSGTSCASKLLSVFGYYLGANTTEGNISNEKGYFEDNYLMEANRTFLYNVKKDPDFADIIFYNADDMEKYAKYFNKDAVLNYLQEHNFTNNQWSFKDPRICLTLPLWADVANTLNSSYACIFPIRNPLDVAKSLQKRNHFTLSQGLLLWFRYTVSLLLNTKNTPLYIFDFNELLSNIDNTAEGLANFLGTSVSLHSEAFEEFKSSFLDKNLKNHASNDRDLEDACKSFSFIAELYQELRMLSLEKRQISTAKIQELSNKIVQSQYLVSSSPAVGEFNFFPVKLKLKPESGKSKNEVIYCSKVDKEISFKLASPMACKKIKLTIAPFPCLVKVNKIDVLLSDGAMKSMAPSAVNTPYIQDEKYYFNHNEPTFVYDCNDCVAEINVTIDFLDPSMPDNRAIFEKFSANSERILHFIDTQTPAELANTAAYYEEKYHEATRQYLLQKKFCSQFSNSISWKITAPLRYLFALFNKKKSKDEVKKSQKPKTNAPTKTNQLDYENWIKLNEMRMVKSSEFELNPLISVLVPTYNSNIKFLRECIESILNQTYTNFELCIADDNSTDNAVREVIEEYANFDSRIKYVFRKENGHISAASNSALALATGEWITLVDHDDVIPTHAFAAFVECINANANAKIIYSDEDSISKNGARVAPRFKPDWNRDLLYSMHYICHLIFYGSDVINKIQGFREGLQGCQDYDLLLRAILHVRDEQIFHIPKILYHWRNSDTSFSRSKDKAEHMHACGIKALSNHFKLQGKNVEVSWNETYKSYRVKWPLPLTKPLVSLIIPTKDMHELLRKAVESIINKTTYSEYEIIIVDNGSVQEETKAYLKTLENTYENIKVLKYDKLFNYSAINNFAAKYSSGEILGLINNDIEVISDNWLTEMVSLAVREDIGCVGAKLYYPNDTIQHAGIITGLHGSAGHSFHGAARDATGYLNLLNTVRNVSANTAACLIVRKSIYEEVGGFNELDYKIALNDVDFCLKVRKLGYRNIWTPYAELYHHESASRGYDISNEKRSRFLNELQTLKDTWQDLLLHDPYYNVNLSNNSNHYGIGYSNANALESMNAKENFYKNNMYLRLKKYVYLLNNIPETKVSTKYENCIWQLWLQGEEKAPEIVKICLESAKNYACNRKVIVINEKNISEFINLPDYVMQKYKQGIITATHLSDIIRILLLAKYGGTWIDATVLLTDKIPDKILEQDFFAYKTSPWASFSKCPSEKMLVHLPSFNLINWMPATSYSKPATYQNNATLRPISSWFMHAKPNNKLINAVKHLMLAYWKQESALIDYFLIHDFFALAIVNNKECGLIYENMLALQFIEPHLLAKVMNENFDEEIMAEIRQFSTIHKLSYKDEYKDSSTSFYSFLSKKEF